MNDPHLILDHQDIESRLKRMAYQIYEDHLNEDLVVLAGIGKNGVVMTNKLQNELLKIASIKTLLCRVSVEKKTLSNPIKTSISQVEYKNKSVVLIDDVLNSGATLIYVVKHFLEVPLKQLKTAVLVDRNHKKYPIKVNYKGISLSTSLQNHVEVQLNPKSYSALLF